MNRLFNISILLASVYFMVSMIQVDNTQTYVKKAFFQGVNAQDSLRDAVIRDYMPYTDSNLNSFLPNFDFYYQNVSNPNHWEYNNGIIQTIAAVSKTSNKGIYFLLPQDYSDNADNFCSLFYGKQVHNREGLCKSIANLFVKTYTRSAFNCEEKMKNLTHTAHLTDSSVPVVTTWIENCQELSQNSENGKTITYVAHKSTVFEFNENSLSRIDYSAWKD